MRTSTSLIVLVLALSACRTGDPDCGSALVYDRATRACACPEGTSWDTDAEACVALTDGGVDDASSDGAIDVCSDADACVPEWARVRIIHAAFRSGDVRVQINGTERASLAYGSASAPIAVSPSEAGTIEVVVVGIDGAPIVETTSVRLEAPTLLVIGPRTADAGETLYALDDSLAPASAEGVPYRVLNTMVTADAVLIGDALTPAATLEALALGDDSGTIVSPIGTANVSMVDFTGEMPGDTLASFTFSLVESAWIVLIGDLRAPPGAPRGPAAVVVESAGRWVAADPLVQVLNATADDRPVFLCPMQAGAPVAAASSLAARDLRGARAVPTSFVIDVELGIGPDGVSACDSPGAIVPLGGLDLARRYLFVITDTAASPVVTTIIEPRFETPSSSDSIQLSFTHLAATAFPSAALRLHDGTTQEALSAFSSVGVTTFGWVTRAVALGPIEIRNPSISTALAGATWLEADLTDVIHVLYVDATGGVPRGRVVHAPYARSWHASVLNP